MLVRGVPTVSGLTLTGRLPSWRTWERQLNALPATLPTRIA
jgi:hypothetical protein